MASSKSGLVWLILGGSAIGIGLGTVALTDWLNLNPCYLCIFQRLLILVFGVVALAIAATHKTRPLRLSLGLLALCAAVAGAVAAAYQSWLQIQPPGASTCVGGSPGPIEMLVEWLGQQAPSLFLATGFCEDEGLDILGLSLANWSLLCFLGLTAVTAWTLWTSSRHNRP